MGKLGLREAIVIVGQGRAYQRENYPVGHPGKFVGHIPAERYDEALDLILAEVPELVDEPCSVAGCAYPRMMASPCCYGHLVDADDPAHIAP